MALRDSAIVAYAETKVMKKSDRDVFVLIGEMLESLLDKTGFEKKRDRRAGGGGTDRHRRRQHVLGADHRRRAGPRGRLLRAGEHRRLLGGGRVARAAAAIEHGLCEVAFCSFADTHVREHNGRNDRNYRREWTDPYGLLGPPGAFGLLQPRLRREIRRRLPHARQARGDAAQPRHPERERLRKAARADHHRRLPELAHDRRSDPAAGLRDAGRRRRRPDHDEPARRPRKRASTSTSSRSAMPSAPTSSAAKTSST